MKNELRKFAKQIRKTLDIPEKSRVLTDLIRQNESYKTSKNVMLFYPTKFEINFLDLLNDNKNFYFPRVRGEDLLVCPYKKGEKIEKSALGICEPCSAPVSPSILDLIIVPALSVDKKGYRLGYGGGFYDRFLKNVNAKTICAIPKELCVEALPVEEFDFPIDIIITE